MSDFLNTDVERVEAERGEDDEGRLKEIPLPEIDEPTFRRVVKCCEDVKSLKNAGHDVVRRVPPLMQDVAKKPVGDVAFVEVMSFIDALTNAEFVALYNAAAYLSTEKLLVLLDDSRARRWFMMTPDEISSDMRRE